MFRRKKFRLRLPSRVLVLGERTLIMGILNVTPDSFSDGGEFANPDKAIVHAFAIERAGADLLDVGGESTRPGSTGILAQEEMKRILPVLEGLRGKLKIPICLDTRKSEVAEAASALGIEMLNDVSGLHADPRLANVAFRHRLPMILMHMRGEPQTMQKSPFAANVVKDVAQGLRVSLACARKAGVLKSQIVLDPGIGFGKKYAQNFEILAHLPELAKLGCPLVIGTSRKGFLGRSLGGVSEKERIWGTAASVAASILGGAHIVRVHDVAEIVQVARVTDRIANPRLAASDSLSS